MNINTCVAFLWSYTGDWKFLAFAQYNKKNCLVISYINDNNITGCNKKPEAPKLLYDPQNFKMLHQPSVYENELKCTLNLNP